jgi:hypothetical protein
MDKKNLRITDLPADCRRQEDIESWNGFITAATSKLAVLRMALAGIETSEDNDEDWLRDLTSCQALIDEADIGKRPEIRCLIDLLSGMVGFSDKYSHLDHHVTGVLVDKIAVIEMALHGFKTDDQAIFLGYFIQEVMDYLDTNYIRHKDELKEKIKELMQEKDHRDKWYRSLKRRKNGQANGCTAPH